MLQNASATGGLRGGNFQGALAQFRPAMLQNQLDQQYNKWSGLAGLGQASAAGQAAQGMAMAGNVGNLMGQGAAAQAGGIMGQGSIASNTFGDLLSIANTAVSGYRAYKGI